MSAKTSSSSSNQDLERSSERSYFEKRIYDEMGLTPEQNKITLSYEYDDWRTVSCEKEIFSEDKYGNIKILLYDIYGSIIQYNDPNGPSSLNLSNRMINYCVTRYAPANIKEGGHKYGFPSKQGVYPFFPPSLVEKFKRKEQINTLVLTEGYMKAMSASIRGFDIVGLGSITHYADSNTRELNSGIKNLINNCSVQKVVILYDGDCLNLSEKDLEGHRDLARRPKTFYNALINTRDLLVDFSDVKIEFAYVLSDRLIHNPKGLDDLLQDSAYANKAADILRDLTETQINSRYFFRMNIREQVKRLKMKFFIDSVDSFYRHWQDKLGTKNFIFDHMVYSYNVDEGKVIRAANLAIYDFVRVGDDYYEKVARPSVLSDHVEVKLVPRRKSTIVDDFGKAELKNVPKYKSFINKPSHVDYHEVINNCYNLYSPLTYHAEQGIKWPTIQYLMEHIFGEQIEYGYDYMQLLYLRPTQILPILCLVSQERQTGKTSFLDLLREIYASNAIIVGNSEITSEFNALVSGKLLVMVDETALEDNTKVTERLKMLSTAKKMPVQRKGMDHFEIENFTKYILCSNNETRFIYTEEDETRFWVRKVAPIPKEISKPNVMEAFHEEIPGFLSFLLSRTMHVKEAQSRMWFDHKDIETEAERRLKEKQQRNPVKAIRSAIKQLFIDFPKTEYLISIKVLQKLVPSIEKIDSETIVSYLHDYLQIPSYKENGVSKTKYCSIPYYSMEGETEVVKKHTDRGKLFVFTLENFCQGADLEYVYSQLCQAAQFSTTDNDSTEDESDEDSNPRLPYKD